MLLTGVASVAVPRPAAAQGREPSAADALFQKGREAMARGDLATACARFAESERLDPAPGTLLNVAQCEEKDGKLTASLTHLNEVLETLPKSDFRVEYVRRQLAALRPRVPTVTVTLAKGTAARARVIRDGVELRQGSFDAPLPVDPGVHMFIVRVEGRQDAHEQVTLREGQQLTLTLSAGGPSESVVPVPAQSEADAGGGKPTLGIAVLAVGGAGLVTGVVTGLMFASAASTYRSHCDSRGCDGDEGLSAASRAKTLNVVSPVAFGVAALGLGLGTYLVLTTKGVAPRQGRLSVEPQISTNAQGLMLNGAF